MRSRAGVGITPPKVLGAPKPTSSVMISSTFGAPLGGTARGRPPGLRLRGVVLDHAAELGRRAGAASPSMVVVALGEPGTPVVCWAAAMTVVSMTVAMNSKAVTITRFYPHLFPPLCLFPFRKQAYPADRSSVRIVSARSRLSVPRARLCAAARAS